MSKNHHLSLSERQNINISNNQMSKYNKKPIFNIFYSYECLAQCPKCGLIKTNYKRKCQFLPCICFTFCLPCFMIRQCISHNDISCCNSTHSCPICGKVLGLYDPCEVNF